MANKYKRYLLLLKYFSLYFDDKCFCIWKLNFQLTASSLIKPFLPCTEIYILILNFNSNISFYSYKVLTFVTFKLTLPYFIVSMNRYKHLKVICFLFLSIFFLAHKRTTNLKWRHTFEWCHQKFIFILFKTHFKRQIIA